MLSPSISTKSKSNVWRQIFIRAATSNWATVPVPMSPIAAKRIASGCPRGDARNAARAILVMNCRREICIVLESGKGVKDEIHNHVRLGVLKDKRMIDDAIRQFFRQAG